MGEDRDETGGARRTHFRRYAAGVDQHDPHQVERLGDALGALIDEVAASKRDFLVKAAERDGFFFADGVFRPAGTGPRSFAVTSADDLTCIDDRGRLLHVLANDRPQEAIGGAEELIESVCRTVLRLIGEPAPAGAAGFVDVTESTLAALELVPAESDDAKKRASLVRRSLQQLSAAVAELAELRNASGSRQGRDGGGNGLLPRHARLAVGAAVAFAGFVAETYVEQAASENGRRAL